VFNLNAYLTFNGNCAEAFHFYERVLGGKINLLLSFSASPMADQIPPGHGDKIMHASMTIDGHALMGSDNMPGQPYEGMKGFSLSLNYPTVDRAEATFTALSQGGTIRMPLQATFWAAAFGMLTDRYGTPWMVNCEKPA